MLDRQTWAVISDGTRARILRDLDAERSGAGVPPDLVLRSRSVQLRSTLEDCEVPAAATAPLDIVLQDMQQFAREISAVLEGHRLAGDFTGLALFASAAMLPVLHREMPSGLHRLLLLERAGAVALGPADLLRRMARRAILERRG